MFKTKSWSADQSGQAMSEYGLLIAVIIIGLAAIVGLFRNKLGETFNKAINQLNTENNTQVQAGPN